jgi:hydroxymethylpyrimidine pyrophosphatase-like HAD family hydrolase
MVALDIDGTLLGHDLQVAGRVKGAVRDVVDAGHHVVIATGRSVHGTTPVLSELGLERGYAVCSNGGFTLRLDPSLPGGFEVADVVTFDPWSALLALRSELPGAAFAVETAHSDFLVAGEFPADEMAERVTLVPFEALQGVPATRVVVRSLEHTPQDFLELTAALGLSGVNYAVGWTAWLDLAPEGVSKASALEAVRVRLGVAPQRTVAVGDGRNDVEMLAWATRSAAMGQAPPEVRACATEVTGTIDEDGAAQVLESLLTP